MDLWAEATGGRTRWSKRSHPLPSFSITATSCGPVVLLPTANTRRHSNVSHPQALPPSLVRSSMSCSPSTPKLTPLSSLPQLAPTPSKYPCHRPLNPSPLGQHLGLPAFVPITSNRLSAAPLPTGQTKLCII